MTIVISMKPHQQEHCDLCKRCLRIKIISVSPTIIYEIYGNPTSQYGDISFINSGFSSRYFTTLFKGIWGAKSLNFL